MVAAVSEGFLSNLKKRGIRNGFDQSRKTQDLDGKRERGFEE